MNTKFSANYSVSVEASLPENGLIIYDFPDFDSKAIMMIRAVESVRSESSHQFSVVDDGDTIIISLPRMSGDERSWTLPKSEQARGFRDYTTGNTWGKAHEQSSIRILRVLGRYFPIDIAGSQH